MPDPQAFPAKMLGTNPDRELKISSLRRSWPAQLVEFREMIVG